MAKYVSSLRAQIYVFPTRRKVYSSTSKLWLFCSYISDRCSLNITLLLLLILIGYCFVISLVRFWYILANQKTARRKQTWDQEECRLAEKNGVSVFAKAQQCAHLHKEQLYCTCSFQHVFVDFLFYKILWSVYAFLRPRYCINNWDKGIMKYCACGFKNWSF